MIFKKQETLIMKRLAIILLISLLALVGNTQESNISEVYDLSVTPPSPNSTALGEYADVPVSLYTGTPNVSIPIHTFQGKHLSVPIGLSYHASGIKVDEIASSVGLGWALNAGGVITRTIYGLPDEIGAGFQNQPTDLGNQPNLLEAAARGRIDAQPDMFFFNFQGSSGKFIISNNGIMVAPYQDIKIETGSLFQSWTITTNDGIRYFFGGEGAIEKTLPNSFYCESEQNPDDDQITSWYLKTIEHPNGEIITFDYGNADLQYISSVSQSQSFPMYGETCSGCYFNTIVETCAQQVNVSSKYLRKISGSTGSMEFAYSGREDLPGGVKLDTISCKGTNGQAYREVTLSYDYFDSPGRSAIENVRGISVGQDQIRKRLKLRAVYAGEQFTPPYQLEYNEEGNYQLPPRFSYQQDHWGYANSNPKYTLIPINNNFHQFQDGADRSADEERTKAGSLKKITYPTGGHATFEFEAHDYGFRSKSDANAFATVRDSQFLSVSAVSEDTFPKKQSFTIEVSQLVKVTSSIMLDPLYPVLADFPMVEIINTDNGASLFSRNDGGTLIEELFLVPGNYEVIIHYVRNGDESVSIDLEWVYVLADSPENQEVQFSPINSIIVEPRSIQVDIGLEDPKTVQVIPFTVNVGQFINMTSKIWAEGIQAGDIGDQGEEGTTGEGQEGGDVVGLAEIRHSGGSLFTSASIGSQAVTRTIYFEAGDYEIYIDIAHFECASFHLEWDEYVELEADQDGVYKNLAGGLRIKKVEMYDGTKDIVNHYSYVSEDEGDRSSGVNLNEPQYFTNRLVGILGIYSCTPNDRTAYICNRIQGSSSSMVHLGSTQGSHVGYTNVSVTRGGGQAGRTVSWFSFVSDDGYTGFPFGPITSQDWQRGFLEKMIDYDSGDNPVREVTNNYDFVEQGRVTGYRTALEIANLQNSPAIVATQPYDVISGWAKLNSTTEILDGVTKTTNYTYGSSEVLTNLRSTEFTNSDNRIYKTEYDYATDVNNEDMESKHLLSIPVETRQLVNGEQVGGVRTIYAKGEIEGGGTYENLIVPKDLYRWEGQDWDTVGQFTAYTPDGFPKEFVKKHYEDFPITYGWNNGLLQSKEYSNFLWQYMYEGTSHRQLKMAINPDGTASEYSYDGIQRLETAKQLGVGGVEKSTITLSYNYGNPASDGNYINSTTSYSDGTPSKSSNRYFDGLGRPFKTVMKNYVNGQDVITQEIEYVDGINRVAKKTHLVGNFESFEYEPDPLDRVKITTLPDGNTLEVDYGNEGQYYQQILKDEKGNETTTTTDILGRTAQIKDAKQGSTIYQYDDWGNIIDITTPLGNQYVYTYDNSQNHLASKSIPGGGVTTFDYYDDKDLLQSQTDANGNELTYEYDEYDRILLTYKGGEVMVKNKYYESDHVDKIEYTEYTLLGATGKTIDAYVYDEFGRVFEYNYTHLLGMDKTINTYDNADRLLESDLNHTGYQTEGVLNEFTYDDWDRPLTTINTVNSINSPQEIANHLLYDERDQLRAKSIGGGLQMFNYQYESSRGWLQQINDPLGVGQSLAACEKIKPNNPVKPPVVTKAGTPTLVDINLLLTLRQTLRFQIQKAIDSIGCEPKFCPPIDCTPAEAAAQDLCLWEAIEDTKNQTGTTVSIPCEDGTTEDEWVPDVDDFPFPVDMIRVRLCNGTEHYLLRNSAEKLCGPYEEQQSITITSPDQVFAIPDSVELTILNLEELLTMIVNGETPPLEDYVECDTPYCPPVPQDCSDVILAVQQAAIDIIKPIVPEITIADLPVTIYEMATCTGDIFYVLEKEYPIVEHTEMEVIDTITIDSLTQEIPIQIDPPNAGDCEDLFHLYLEYEENGNIASKSWQVYGRQLTQYIFDYDDLNRLERANYSQASGSRNTTSGNQYGIPTITYDADGNITRLVRNGITGTCDNGLPTYGAIDVLDYEYNHSNAPNRLVSVEDGTGNEKGFNPGEGSGSYGYDDNGNLISDPYKALIIKYNYLNLPEEIKKGGDVIKIIYDAAGRKLQQEFIPAEGEGVLLDYISGIEYRNAEINSVYHSEGRAFNSEEGWRYEYSIKDHLGNTRLMISDLNGDGCISPLSDPSEILQENHYYPFGLNMDGPWAKQYQKEETDEDGNGVLDPILDEEGNPVVDQEKLNRYQFNGKELTEDLGLNWNDYGARWYDPTVGRWNAVDPLAEEFYEWSPYNYTVNNPINYTDPDGRLPVPIVTGIIGGVGGAIFGFFKGKGVPLKQRFKNAGKGLVVGGVSGLLMGTGFGVASALGTTGIVETAVIGGGLGGALAGGVGSLTAQGFEMLAGERKSIDAAEVWTDVLIGVPAGIGGGILGGAGTEVIGKEAGKQVFKRVFKRSAKRKFKKDAKRALELGGLTKREARQAVNKAVNAAKKNKAKNIDRVRARVQNGTATIINVITTSGKDVLDRSNNK